MVQILDDTFGKLNILGSTVDIKQVAPVRYPHAKAFLDDFQMCAELTAQTGKALVIFGGEMKRRWCGLRLQLGNP